MSIKVDERFAVCSQPNGRLAAFLVNKRDSMYPTIGVLRLQDARV